MISNKTTYSRTSRSDSTYSTPNTDNDESSKLFTMPTAKTKRSKLVTKILNDTLLEVVQFSSTKYTLNDVKELLEAGADVNAKNNDGNTALILAARNTDINNSFNAVKTLLEAGANVNIANNEGKTALIVAIASEYAQKASNMCVVNLIDDYIKNQTKNTEPKKKANVPTYTFSNGRAVDDPNEDISQFMNELYNKELRDRYIAYYKTYLSRENCADKIELYYTSNGYCIKLPITIGSDVIKTFDIFLNSNIDENIIVCMKMQLNNRDIERWLYKIMAAFAYDTYLQLPKLTENGSHIDIQKNWINYLKNSFKINVLYTPTIVNWGMKCIDSGNYKNIYNDTNDISMKRLYELYNIQAAENITPTNQSMQQATQATQSMQATQASQENEDLEWEYDVIKPEMDMDTNTDDDDVVVLDIVTETEHKNDKNDKNVDILTTNNDSTNTDNTTTNTSASTTTERLTLPKVIKTNTVSGFKCVFPSIEEFKSHQTVVMESTETKAARMDKFMESVSARILQYICEAIYKKALYIFNGETASSNIPEMLNTILEEKGDCIIIDKLPLSYNIRKYNELYPNSFNRDVLYKISRSLNSVVQTHSLFKSPEVYGCNGQFDKSDTNDFITKISFQVPRPNMPICV